MAENAFNAFINAQTESLQEDMLKERAEIISTSLSVHVVDESGNDLEKARVALNGQLFYVTDAKGICWFLNTAEGTHELEISLHGYEVNTDKITFNPEDPKGMPLKYTLKAKPVTYVLKVTDRRGIPLEGAAVTLGDSKTQTAKDGTVKIENVRLNQGTPLVVTKKGHEEVKQKVILPPRNWSTEVYQSIALSRKEQFSINTAFQVNDSKKTPPNNGDGKANAGEIIKVPITVENISDEATEPWTLSFRCDSPYIEFLKKPVYENKPLEAGEKRGFLVPMKIKTSVKKYEILRIVATILPNGDFLAKEQKMFPLPIYEGEPLDFKIMVDPILKDSDKGDLAQRNNGNDVMGPGEICTVRITVGNRGDSVKDVRFFLETVPRDAIHPARIKLQKDRNKSYELRSAQMVDPIFVIDVPKGVDTAMMPFMIMAESHGRVWGETFSLPVEGKSDFHVSMTGKGKPVKGSACNFVIKCTYSGEKSFIANFNLTAPGGGVTFSPDKIRGQQLASNETIDLSGIMTISPHYHASSFKVTLEIQDLMLGNSTVYKKDFRFKLAE